MSQRPPIMPSALGLLMMLAVFAAHFTYPVMMLFPYPWNYLGIVFILAGAVLHIMADVELKRKGAISDEGQQDQLPKKLVTGSVYTFTRNPAYLGLVLINAGLACWVGSLSAWLVVAVFPVILFWYYIREEETQLSKQFGERYQRYCQIVPRWLRVAKRL